jgi:hypothetical protein
MCTIWVSPLRDNVALRQSPYWPSSISAYRFATTLLPIGALLGFDIALTNVAFRLSSVALVRISSYADDFIDTYVYDFLKHHMICFSS